MIKLKKIIAVLVAWVVVISAALVFSVAGNPVVLQGAAFRDVHKMVSDPVTSDFTKSFQPSTIENGHVWVDKSVSTGGVTLTDHQNNPVYTIIPPPDQFLVSLSALSQSYSIETVREPSDVVFIVDASGSMYSNQIGGQSRAALMISALNDAIRTIMDANPENRVSVVYYGGYQSGSTWYSAADVILKLGHYDVPGDYFSISGNGISVNPNIPAQYAAARNVTVQGGTPTQRGIYRGAKILTDNPDTQYTHTTESGKEITVTRRPSVVLLTDGDPTYGWRNYKVEGGDTDAGYDCGNGSASDMGVDLLTVLTAAYWKQQIRDHYYGEADTAARFYTIGVGVSGVHAPSVMNPTEANTRANSQTFNGTAYNMQTLLDQFVDPAFGTIAFPALRRESTSRDLTTAVNTDNYIKDYLYTDGYFPADDKRALDSAFQTIARDVISAGNYATEADPVNPDFSGYLVFTDPIGEYMQFKNFKGVWVNGDMYYGSNMARYITQGSVGSAIWDETAHALAARLGVGRSAAEQILLTNIAAGQMYYNSDSDFKSALRWYADSAGDFAGFYYDASGAALPAPAGAAGIVELRPIYNSSIINDISGEHTSLLRMYLTVTTALETGLFEVKGHAQHKIPLVRGQQMVKWYIPASLIPVRTVAETYDEQLNVNGLTIKEAFPISVHYTVGLADNLDIAGISGEYKADNQTPEGTGYYFYSDAWKGESAYALFEPNSYNPYYYFTQDTPLFTFDGTGYAPAGAYAPGVDYYVLQKYFDRNVPGYLADEYRLVDQRITAIAEDARGIPYIPAGERRETGAVIAPKQNNPTLTSPYMLAADYAGPLQFYMLGNNGRLEISALSGLTVRKEWRGAALPYVWARLYADGAPYGEPVVLSDANGWRHVWPELPIYAAKPDPNGEVHAIAYTVAEGDYGGGVFTPYSAGNPLEGYDVEIIQPVWDDEAGAWADALIINTEINNGPEEPSTPTSAPPDTPTSLPPGGPPPSRGPAARRPARSYPPIDQPTNQPPEQPPYLPPYQPPYQPPAVNSPGPANPPDKQAPPQAPPPETAITGPIPDNYAHELEELADLTEPDEYLEELEELRADKTAPPETLSEQLEPANDAQATPPAPPRARVNPKTGDRAGASSLLLAAALAAAGAIAALAPKKKKKS